MTTSADKQPAVTKSDEEWRAQLSPEEQNRVRSGAQPPGGHGDGSTPLQSPRGGEKH